MAVLITGINGFVGKTLYKQLSIHDEVIGVSRKNETNNSKIYTLNLLDERATVSFFENYKDNKIKAIVHLASRTANQHNLDDLSVIADNSAMAKNIAMVAKNLKIKTIIHLSSASVYPNLDGDYDETSIVNPSMNSDALYGLSKLNEEVLLDHFCDKQTNVIHLRSAMIYGLGMDTTRIIPVLEREINEKGTATLFANGTRLINMVDVNVLVDLIIYLIKHPEKGVVNVADECIPLIDLAKRIIETSNYKSSKIILNPAGNSYQFRLVAKKYLALKVKMKHV